MRAIIAVTILALSLTPAFAQKNQTKKPAAKPFDSAKCMERFAKQGLQAFEATRKCSAIQKRSG